MNPHKHKSVPMGGNYTRGRRRRNIQTFNTKSEKVTSHHTLRDSIIIILTGAAHWVNLELQTTI